jgi:excinuclease ABC subunit C
VFNIEEELKKLPKQPGVYIMRDKSDGILYVGKAINLHNRVRSYFRENIGRGPAIDQMVRLIARFEYIVTDSELEALVLENNLIKEHSPKYNTLLKDDKTYPYIKVTLGEPFPRILFSRTMKKDKSKYFGPYTSAAAVKDTIELLNKLYQLRTCNKNLPKDIGIERPCLNYHIKQCLAPCQGYVSQAEYRKQVDGAMEFLNGNYGPILRDLEQKMKAAAENLEFEEAATFRDLYNSVKSVAQKQKITDSGGEDKDVIAMCQEGTEAVVQVFFVRDGKLIGREHYYMTHVSELPGEELFDVGGSDEAKTPEGAGLSETGIGGTQGEGLEETSASDEPGEGLEDGNETDIMANADRSDNAYARFQEARRKVKAETLRQFLQQFYAGTPFIPREIMLQYEVEDQKLIEEWLTNRKGSRVYLRVPKIGSKEKLVELAAQNAKLILDQDREHLKREEGRTIGAVKEIAAILGLKGIERMEAFDISNTNGFENVASMVVFEKGKPKPSDYRKFRMKTVAGPDDYACMREALTRRFTHGLEEAKELREKGMDEKLGSFTRFPDLLMMDGGRGQVNIALEVLGELGLHVPVCGMVKDDNHRTRGLYFNNVEMPIDTHSEGFKLITRVQDEAHRFAIEYHRSLRGKAQVRSVLEEVPGIGPARRKALMRKFGSLEEIKNATVEELAEIPELNEKVAKEILAYFQRV